MLPALRRVRPAFSRTTVAVIVASFVTGWVGATGFGAATASERVHLQGDDRGVVTFVNVDGSKFCFTSDRDGKEQCGAAYRATAVVVGERVEVTVARVPLGPEASKLTWIVTLPSPR
jgi:hypothetical protein